MKHAGLLFLFVLTFAIAFVSMVIVEALAGFEITLHAKLLVATWAALMAAIAGLLGDKP